jgi:hypothetical protein
MKTEYTEKTEYIQNKTEYTKQNRMYGMQPNAAHQRLKY